MKYPKASFIIPTYNNKFFVKRCLDSILSQDYPKENIEIICVDGGSTDGTLDLLKKYKVKIIHNKKRFPEGRGMGKSQGLDAAKNEIIIFVDQDNKLIGKDWLKHMVEPIMKDKNIFGCACLLYIDKNDNITNRYLSYVGTDPFAIFRSLEGKVGLEKIKFNDEGNYYTYLINKDDFLCAGGNCFLFRKSFLKKVGGYTHDVDTIYELVLHGINKLAVPKYSRTHHLTISNFSEFLKKRFFWAMHYTKARYEDRKYSWMPSIRELPAFSWFILSNIIIIPNIFTVIRRFIKTKDTAWFLHPIAMFCITLIYGFVFLYSRIKR